MRALSADTRFSPASAQVLAAFLRGRIDSWRQLGVWQLIGLPLVALVALAIAVVAETGAVASLQPGFIPHYGPSLLDRGVKTPRDHVVLIGAGRVATLLVSPAPFSPAPISAQSPAVERRAN
mgnify:CR=1 FL=1